MTHLEWLVPASGVLALVFAYYRAAWVISKDPGTERMVEIGGFIADGAMAFLKREYTVIAIFIAIVTVLLSVGYWGSTDSHPIIALSFVLGAICSGLAGFFGMKVATKANTRTAAAARTGLAPALEIAFSGGSVMGMCVVGLGLLGLGSLYIFYSSMFSQEVVIKVIPGFSLGASSIALFARVGGGIYTKAADVGADLVGKVEAGIPEDDPRNPAVIADNVGDNVGDVAGMGADLFESYIGAIVGAMVLGLAMKEAVPDAIAIKFPMVLAAVGIVVSIIGTYFVKTEEGGNPQRALNIGTFGAGGVMLVATYFLARWMLPETWTVDGRVYTSFGIFAASVIGLIAGILVGIRTEHYCATENKSVQGIAEQSLTGSATNIIYGLGVGMRSTADPVILIVLGTIGSFYFGGFYGVAMAALGMLSTTGIQLAVDAYGPISDNAGGIAEMAHLPPEVRQRTDKLDAVGNTTAAIGKGFAIASAAMTALVLLAAYMSTAGLKEINLVDPYVISGLMIGAMLPFLFSSMALGAVGRAAKAMIEEVRRQFREIPGLMEGNAVADHARCVDISTSAAIREMVVPGLMAVIVPVVIGIISKEMLGGLLAGVTSSGVCLAIFMSNAGGAQFEHSHQADVCCRPGDRAPALSPRSGCRPPDSFIFSGPV